jgi:hypothetical protein
MSILSVLVLIVVVGVLLWAVNSYVPMAAPVKKLLNVVVVLGLVLWLLWAFGVFGYLGVVHLPGHLRR